MSAVDAMSVNLNDTAILNFKGVDYPCINSKISKSEAINLNAKYRENVEHYKA